jgi:hypothetical protein
MGGSIKAASPPLSRGVLALCRLLKTKGLALFAGQSL